MGTKNKAVAWTVIGPDGETSIGGWLGMHTYEASLKWATLRDGHSYAFAYAEDEELHKDAERWRHARKLLTVDDIFTRQRELESWNKLASEDECLRADKAIDMLIGYKS